MIEGRKSEGCIHSYPPTIVYLQYFLQEKEDMQLVWWTFFLSHLASILCSFSSYDILHQIFSFHQHKLSCFSFYSHSRSRIEIFSITKISELQFSEVLRVKRDNKVSLTEMIDLRCQFYLFNVSL